MKERRLVRFCWSLRLAAHAAALVLGLLATGRSIAQEVPSSVLQAEQERIAAIERASKSAVAIFARGGGGGGSGVVISPDGYALTNFHVVQPCGSHMQCGMNDGNLYDAVVVGIDPTGDVALIKLLGRDDFPVATLADSDQVQVGDWCFAVGNPFLLATDFTPTVTYGIVSGVHRYQYPAGTILEYADCIQTDAAINPGNSGGPLFNANGDLIGVNGRGSFEKRGRVNVGVGYAISINQIKHFLGCLKSGRIVDHATLGANVTTAEDGRVLVSNILESSDAYRRGLRYDDEIVSFGGRRIDTTNAFKNVLGIYPKGWRVPLTYRRDGKDHDIVVRLTGVHGEEELLSLIEKKATKPEGPKPAPKKPGEEDGKPGREKEDGQPKQPGDDPLPKQPQPGDEPKPMSPHGQADDPPVPPEVKKLIVERHGYANYYFNELNRNRVWDAFKKSGDFSSQTGDWTFSGDLAAGGKVKLIVGEKKASGEFPSGPVEVDPNTDLDEQLGPPQSGGLVATAWLWRQLLVGGPEKFGDLHYYGTAPYEGVADHADVMTGLKNVVEADFVFDPASGQLSIAEMRPTDDLDSCLIRFSDYRDVAGRQVPFRWQIVHGDTVYGEIQWTDIELAAGEGAK
jgi:serine protease Do